MPTNWGELSLPAVALLVLAMVVIELARNYKAKGESKAAKEEPPVIPVEAFAQIVGVAVAEAVKPFYAVVDNNTDALNEMRIQMAKQNGKTDNILNNTNLLLQQRHQGGDDGC